MEVGGLDISSPASKFLLGAPWSEKMGSSAAHLFSLELLALM